MMSVFSLYCTQEFTESQIHISIMADIVITLYREKDNRKRMLNVTFIDIILEVIDVVGQDVFDNINCCPSPCPLSMR